MPFTFERGGNATRVNKEGLIEIVGENIPRIDFSNDSNGALLLEPERTNLETKSNEFSTWGTASNTTRTADYIISPDGTQNATRLQFTANGYIANTLQSLATYTVSCYAKRNDNGTQNVGFFTNGSGVVNSAWDITSEWKRFTYTFPALNGSFLGIAGVSGADISVYGFQLEGLVSYPTSYIPTQGSPVTRVKDSCSQIPPDGVIGQTEGTIFAEIDYTPHSINYEMIASLKGTSTNQYIEFYFESNNRLGFGIYNGAVVQMSFTSAVQTKGIKKIAIAYKSNDFAIYLNGTQLHTDNSGSVPLLSSLGLGNNIALSNYQLSQPIKQFQLYNTRLSNSELAALTQV